MRLILETWRYFWSIIWCHTLRYPHKMCLKYLREWIYIKHSFLSDLCHQKNNIHVVWCMASVSLLSPIRFRGRGNLVCTMSKNIDWCVAYFSCHARRRQIKLKNINVIKAVKWIVWSWSGGPERFLKSVKARQRCNSYGNVLTSITVNENTLSSGLGGY